MATPKIKRAYATVPADTTDETYGLTKGKSYKTDRNSSFKDFESFRITDDNGYEIYCLVTECAHLNGGNWIITYK